MKKILAVTFVAALALSGCAKNNSGLNTNPGANQALVEEQKASAESGFGSKINLGKDYVVSFSTPVHFVPSPYASNFNAGFIANKFEVTLTNNSKSPLDTTSISFKAASGTNVCTDILDGDSGITGAPTSALAAGATETFVMAVGCNAKVGDPLEIRAVFGAEVAALTGTIA